MHSVLPRVSRPLIAAAVVGALALPAVLSPVPGAASSLSSSGPVMGFDEEDGVEVMIPGYGPYEIPAELTGPSLDPVGATADDLLSAAVFAADQEGDAEARDAALEVLSPERRTEVEAVLTAIHSEVPDASTVSAQAPIVVLGNGLNPDGSVHPNLENRLRAAAELAAERPAAPVVVSGGRTEDGHIEAHAMRDWLIEAGVAPERIQTEEQSSSTVANARLTRELLPEATEVLVVSSHNHIHRAVVDFTAAFGPTAAVAGVGAKNEPETPMPTLLGTYRDLVQWYVG